MKSDLPVSKVPCISENSGLQAEAIPENTPTENLRSVQQVARRAVADLKHERVRSERTQQELTDLEERFQLFVEAVQDYAIFMLDAEGNVRTWNEGARRIKGYEADEIIGRHFSEFYSAQDVADGKPARELEIAEREGRVEDEGWRIRKDGTRFWANVVITALRDREGKLRGFGKVTRDSTERMLAQERLVEAGNSLRALSIHLLQSQDEERRRIGRDLHDSLGQYLSVLKMKLDSLSATAEAAGLPGLGGEVRDCARLSEECITEVRTISYLLFPPMLEEMGLRSAITWYLEGFAKRSGIKTEFAADPAIGRLPREVEVSVFRALQESLTNVHRHSGSAAAEVRLMQEDGRVVLSVRDFGKGFEYCEGKVVVAENSAALGVGLRSMSERAAHLGGSLQVVSQQPGTTIKISVPVSSQTPQSAEFHGG